MLRIKIPLAFPVFRFLALKVILYHYNTLFLYRKQELFRDDDLLFRDGDLLCLSQILCQLMPFRIGSFAYQSPFRNRRGVVPNCSLNFPIK